MIFRQNLKDKIKEQIVIDMLRNYFSNNKDINMLAKQYLNNYIYNKKVKLLIFCVINKISTILIIM